uniref:Tubulin domain-containing protein n=1 Tax=Macrostomum lignano TaxID=282301 RepID=A0A1I8FIG1_9PLAT
MQTGQCGNADRLQVLGGESQMSMALTPVGAYLGDSDAAAGSASTMCLGRCSSTAGARTMDSVRAGRVRTQLFRPDNFVSDRAAAGNNWAKGHYGGRRAGGLRAGCGAQGGRELRLPAGLPADPTRWAAAPAAHGTGTAHLQDPRGVPDRIMNTFSVVPSPKVSDTVVEPYNATHVVHQLVENTDETFCIDNEALYDICFRTLKLTTPTLRRPEPPGERPPCRRDQPACGSRPAATPISGSWPSTCRGSQQYRAPSASRSSPSRCSTPRNMMAACDPAPMGRYLTVAAIFRRPHEVERADPEWQKQEQLVLCGVDPNNVKTAVWPSPSSATPPPSRRLFKRVSEQFTAMFGGRPSCTGTPARACDEMEFTEAESNMNDLVSRVPAPGRQEAERQGGGKGETHGRRKSGPLVESTRIMALILILVTYRNSSSEGRDHGRSFSIDYVIVALCIVQLLVFALGTVGNLLLVSLLRAEKLLFWRIMRLTALFDVLALVLHTNDCWMHLIEYASAVPSSWLVYVAYVHTPMSMLQIGADTTRLCLTIFAVLNRAWRSDNASCTVSCRLLPWVAGAVLLTLPLVAAARIALVSKAELTVCLPRRLEACRMRLYFDFTDFHPTLNFALQSALLVALPIAVCLSANVLLAISVSRRINSFQPPGSSRVFNGGGNNSGVKKLGGLRVLIPMTVAFAVCQLGRFLWELRRQNECVMVRLALYYIGVLLLSLDCSAGFYIQVAARPRLRERARRLLAS